METGAAPPAKAIGHAFNHHLLMPHAPSECDGLYFLTFLFARGKKLLSVKKLVDPVLMIVWRLPDLMITQVECRVHV